MRYAVALLFLALGACGPSNPPPSSSAKPAAGAAATGASSSAAGGSSCSARNDAGKGCDIACQSGQSATCRNATGSAEPSCTCTPAK